MNFTIGRYVLSIIEVTLKLSQFKLNSFQLFFISSNFGSLDASDCCILEMNFTIGWYVLSIIEVTLKLSLVKLSSLQLFLFRRKFWIVGCN
jgi:hypothetical protein